MSEATDPNDPINPALLLNSLGRDEFMGVTQLCVISFLMKSLCIESIRAGHSVEQVVKSVRESYRIIESMEDAASRGDEIPSLADLEMEREAAD